MDQSPITVRDGLFETLASDAREHVHLVMIATKPDIIKQAPLYLELKRQGELVVLGHTGQHYDFNLSGGLIEEFGIAPDFNLNIEGPVYQKVSQIIQRLGEVLSRMKALNKTVIPYVHGDTMTAMAASNAAYALEFASVHVEAGIRTLTPKRELFQTLLQSRDIAAYHRALQVRANWELGSIEPYPEQFNTRTTEPATGLHCAPVDLDREFLLNEGFRADRIHVVGNTVADAMKMAMENAAQSKIFETYPSLKDGFIRFCVHRRENCADQKRFTAIFEAMELLVHEGRQVLLIQLFQTKTAIEQFGLTDRLAALMQRPNFICSDVWPYYTDVIAAMRYSTVCATDSGSMQEEMNLMGVPCVTLRFGSDRSETALAGGNLIAPPIEAKLIADLIRYADGRAEMRSIPNLYGEAVSQKIVSAVRETIAREPLFCFEQHRLRIGT